MFKGIINEVRQALREIPGFAVAVVLIAVMCAGIHTTVFYQADGEDLRLVADRGGAEGSGEDDLMERTRLRLGCAEKIPGFTVVVGWSHYNLELSVPTAGMRTMFEDARADVARRLEASDEREGA